MSTLTQPDPSVEALSDPPPRDVIFTANGSKKASRAVARTGALIGMESLNTRPPPEIPVEFVDWPFSKLAERGGNVEAVFEDHLQVVIEEKPKYAVAPDLDAYTGWDMVMEWADNLRHHCETVIVVPKTFHPESVPRRYRVGMPCQERYGPCPWGWPEYAGCDEVHLLGGSPIKHMAIFGEKYAVGKGPYVVPVESVDTSLPIKPSKFGDVWDAGSGQWEETEHSFYEALPRTYMNLRAALNPDRDVPLSEFEESLSRLPGDDEPDLWGGPAEYHHEPDLWGPGETTPMPCRAALETL